jgi:hypothetical protein
MWLMQAVGLALAGLLLLGFYLWLLWSPESRDERSGPRGWYNRWLR